MADNSNEMLPPSLRGKMIGGEKVTGSFVGVAMLGGLGLVAWKVLPILIVLLANTLYAGILAIAVVSLGFIAINFKSTAKLMFAILVRKIHNQLVQRAPYDIVNYIIAQMEQKIAEGQTKMGTLRGANQRLIAQIQKFDELIVQCKDQAEAAGKVGKPAIRDARLRMLGTTDANNKKLKAQLDVGVKLVTLLQAGIENSQIKVEEQKQNVAQAIQMNSVLTVAGSAAADVVAAINGDPEKKALFNESMEAIAQDSALKLGQMDQMMLDIQPIMNEIDMQKIVDAEHGERLLAGFSQTVEQIVAVPVPKVEVIAPKPAESNVVRLPIVPTRRV